MQNGQTDNGAYIAVFSADNSGTFARNALRFDTADNARAYANGLAIRWTMVRSYAVIPEATPKDVSGSYFSRETIEANAIGTIVDY